jgi:hypothetical protein
MAPYQIVAAAVRLFAIWLAVYVVRATPAFLVELRKYDDDVGLAISLGVAGLVIAVVLVLGSFLEALHGLWCRGSPRLNQSRHRQTTGLRLAVV